VYVLASFRLVGSVVAEQYGEWTAVHRCIGRTSSPEAIAPEEVMLSAIAA
jgi:hypothetical protein